MKAKIIMTTAIVGILAFLAEPNGPAGMFWRPSPMVPDAVGIQLPLFMLLGITEALVFGLGIAFLVFGASMVRQFKVSPGLARAAHLSISWVMINWWAHDSLHLHNGMELSGLLKIEYGFHITLMLAGIILAKFFVAMARVSITAERWNAIV
jgi:hypothetical protein